jgi:uncharacterized protein YndB with AHSA1/START domain
MIWLSSQSVAILVVGCLAASSLIAIGSWFVVRALLPSSQREESHAIAAPLMPALGAAFAILTALTLANEAGYLTSAQTIVSNEAADASRLAWASTTPGVQGTAIKTELGRYLVATRTHEWQGSNAANGDDPATANTLATLERAVRAQVVRSQLGTPTSTELLASLDALTADRRARLAAGSRELPALYVITLAVSAIALIANASTLTIRGRWRPALGITGLVVVVGLSMALLFALGTPWRGPIVVSGHPLDAVIRDLANGYFRP